MVISADSMFDLLDGAFGSVGELYFRRFMRSSHTDRWMIGADFVIGETAAVHDVLAFTIYPYHDNLPETLSDIASVFPKDIKKTKIVTDEMISFLRDPRRFHFCFLFEKSRYAGASIESARDALAQAIRDIQRLSTDAAPDKDEVRRKYIRAFQEVGEAAKAKAFNFQNFFNIHLLSVLFATIMLWMIRHSRCRKIGIFPDRDKMTDAYGSIFTILTRLNHSSFCNRAEIKSSIDLLVPSTELLRGARLFYDSLVRIPDYVAGSLSRLDYRFKLLTSDQARHRAIIERFAANNPNLLTIHVFDTAVVHNASTMSLQGDGRSSDLFSNEELLEYAVAKSQRFRPPRRRSLRDGLLDDSSERAHFSAMLRHLLAGVAAGDPRCTAIFHGEA